MFLWVVVMQQRCIIVTKAATFVSFIGCLLKRGTCLWIKMYSIGVCVCVWGGLFLMDLAKLCYKACSEQALARYSKPKAMVSYGKIPHRSKDRRKRWRQNGCAGNGQSPGSWWYASLNSLQPSRRLIVFPSLKYRCGPKWSWRDACLGICRGEQFYRLLGCYFSLAKVPQCTKAILRRCMFRHLKKTVILAKQRKLQK